MKTLLIAGLLALLAGLVWLGMDTRTFGRIVQRQAGAAAASLKSGMAAPAAATSDTPSARSSPAAVRKCLVGQRVEYTNGECPAGSREESLKGDLSVLPATPASPLLPRPAGSVNEPLPSGPEPGHGR